MISSIGLNMNDWGDMLRSVIYFPHWKKFKPDSLNSMIGFWEESKDITLPPIAIFPVESISSTQVIVYNEP